MTDLLNLMITEYLEERFPPITQTTFIYLAPIHSENHKMDHYAS